MEEYQIKIIGEKNFSSAPLLQYLIQSRIPLEIANRFCREIIYELDGKNHFGIGFKNDSGGFEIRNGYFKVSRSPKDITTIHNGSKEVNVFERFTDFLSFLVAYKNHPASQEDFVILNSVSLFEKSRPFLEEHKAIKLYLDRDPPGETCTQYALSLSDKYTDESHLYALHKNLNDWLVNMGKPHREIQGTRPG